MADAYATISMSLPFRDAVVIGKVLFENIRRTSEDTEVRDVMQWCFPGEEFIGALVIF